MHCEAIFHLQFFFPDVNQRKWIVGLHGWESAPIQLVIVPKGTLFTRGLFVFQVNVLFFLLPSRCNGQLFKQSHIFFFF